MLPQGLCTVSSVWNALPLDFQVFHSLSFRSLLNGIFFSETFPSSFENYRIFQLVKIQQIVYLRYVIFP